MGIPEVYFAVISDRAEFREYVMLYRLGTGWARSQACRASFAAP